MTKSFVPWCLVLLASSALAGDGQSGLREAIEAANDRYEAAYNAGDVDGVLAMHTQDAIVMAPNLPGARGHDAIREALVVTLELEGGGTLVLDTVEVGGTGDAAWEVGHYTVTLEQAGEATLLDKGHTTVVWKRVGGDWLMYSDIWNSDLPAPCDGS